MLLWSPTIHLSHTQVKGEGSPGWFLYMITYGNASSGGSVCREGEFMPTAIYSYVCVSLPAFEFSVSTVYVNGHVGLSDVVVTLT